MIDDSWIQENQCRVTTNTGSPVIIAGYTESAVRYADDSWRDHPRLEGGCCTGNSSGRAL
jgi:hypothetical protein